MLTLDDLMGNTNLTINSKPREDILVSICFSDFPATKAAFAAIRDLAQRLDSHFRFREIILVVDENGYECYLPLVEQIADIRVFTTRQNNNYYIRRLIAAEEAIGDVVIIGSFDEITHIDFIQMLEQAGVQNAIVIATRSDRHSLRSWLSTPIIALGRAAGFKVNLNNLQTIAMPRSLLNQVLLHSDPELALRFPPRDPRLPLIYFYVDSSVPFKGVFYQFKRRVQLIQKLLVYMAPILLMIVSLSSTVLMLLGLSYAVYTLGVWVFLDNIAPGWLTTSFMLSVSATFIGISILGLSLGLQQVLNHVSKNNLDKIANEVNRIDLFGKMASDLNVDLNRDGPHPVKDRT